MNGRERMMAMLGGEGAGDFPVVIPYENLFLRDHWAELTDKPWWTQYDPDVATMAGPHLDAYGKLGLDWFRLLAGATQEDQQNVVIEHDAEGTYRVNKVTGERRALTRPPIGGVQGAAQREHTPPAAGVRSIADVDAVIDEVFRSRVRATGTEGADGRLALPRRLMEEFGGEKFPYMYIPSPLWNCYTLWGVEGLMLGLIETPELIEHTCQRLLEQKLDQVEFARKANASGIWLEECFGDMINPEQYMKLNLPLVRTLTDAIRAAGMYMVYYFTGDPHERWDFLLGCGADALALEEGRKGFEIDIEDVAERVDGRMALLGNIDAYGVLERGTDEELRREIERQCRAGRRNKNRFVMSIGSPVTPATSLARVQRYCDLAH